MYPDLKLVMYEYPFDVSFTVTATSFVTNAAVYEWQKIISPIVQTLVLGRAASRL